MNYVSPLKGLDENTSKRNERTMPQGYISLKRTKMQVDSGGVIAGQSVVLAGVGKRKTR